MTRIRRSALVTGFVPFGDVAVNPSQQVAEALDGETIGAVRVRSLVLPVEFGVAIERLGEALDRHRPEVVLALGVAPSRRLVSVERVAINVDDARIADNAARQPIDEPVVPGAPAAYFSTLPVKAIVDALERAALPAEVSQSAGTFVCNHLFFGLMHALRQRRTARAGFIHLPPSAASEADDGIPLPQLVRAVRLALEVSVGVERDLRRAGGRID